MASAIPVFFEILAFFTLTISLLHRYSDMVNHNIVTVVGVFISWFFSFMVIFLLPADLTSTAFRQCLVNYQASTNSTTPIPPNINATTVAPLLANDESLTHLTSTIPQHQSFAIHAVDSNATNSTNLLANHDSVTVANLFIVSNSSSNSTVNPCITPWNYVSDNVLTKLWRFIYWTSQLLTWFVLPVMQSYSMAGDFTTIDKLKSAVRANLIYYTSIGAIFTILLIYVMFKNGIDFANLKVIIISSSNTWGLFLLVVLLGYGLVELPRYLTNRSRYFQSLSRQYFRVGKLNAEKCEADEKLDDVLEEIHQVYTTIGTNEHNPLRRYLTKIVEKCPPDWQRRSNTFRRQAATSNSVYEPDRSKTQDYDVQTMIRLHRKVIKAVHYHRQINCRWNHLIAEVVELEDVARNYFDNQSPISARVFKSTLPKERSFFQALYTSKAEWYWKCVIRIWLYRITGLITALFSIAVVWSEITFPMASFAPRLSIFAYFADRFQMNQQYFYLELFSTISIGYLAICAFYTVFHMKIYNVYYLAPNKQTDEYSLAFSGLLVCRLTAPLCLNYLCLVNRDSHFIAQNSILETSFTTIMGHLDLIPLVNSGLNIFLPLCISAICLAIYFDFGTRVLHRLGFEQFVENDEMTSDLVQTGRELVEREKGKLLRNYESSTGAYHEMLSASSHAPTTTGASVSAGTMTPPTITTS